MNQKIHKIITDIKFLYPCIAYEGNSLKNEIEIITETRLSKVYPIKRKVVGMESVGEDYWGRYSFKDEHNQYYCELDGALYFKGNSMEGEPHYPVKKSIIYEYPDLDEQAIEFKPFIDKVKKYVEENKELTLLEAIPSIKIDQENMLESKIFCHYRLVISS